MDVAWMVGNCSRNDDWELRMSMRSFYRNYRGRGRAWIIGCPPAWIDRSRVRCILWPDPYQACKDANLIQKALRLVMEPELSDPFILCCDDYLVLRPTAPAEFELWHCGAIEDDACADATRWQLRLTETGRRLRKQKFPTWNFDGHIPYPMYKSWVREVLRFDFGADPGMCTFSAILNCSGREGKDLRSEPVRAWIGEEDLSPARIIELLETHRFACLSNKAAACSNVVAAIEEKFGAQAPWER
ncbi:hypothetical protein [Terriglobus aquaticus]|uniref:Uncharacterized protein n=1 Tax=Terriglobus aquaticus TaxID=940139 RepID=A0ABW9KM74_9BACT|nr:hypothetical protein [Terriglobus aquaticus]